MNHSAALLIDFGSTYTKLRAVDIEDAAILGSGHGPSTVTTDVAVGMRAALADLERRMGELPSFRYRLASSSAAGGLRMVTVGLVRELTAEAARQAALGAGAKPVATFAYRLTKTDVVNIAALEPDILLLAGGTDGGNSDVLLHNASLLASSLLSCPIILAGNRVVTDEARNLLARKCVIVAENVMPDYNVLNIGSARDAIRQVFIERIAHAKGLDRAQDMFDRVLMPTPAAVMEGARLLADGYEHQTGLGALLVVDPGGATTDVHSVSSGEPSQPGVVRQGFPEPRAKRTVEGDLGVRHNARSIVEVGGLAAIAEDAGIAPERVQMLIDLMCEDVGWLPQSPDEYALNDALGRTAVRLAVRRHAGALETIYTPSGPVMVQHGKDLTHVGTVVGTGGPLVHARNPYSILETVLVNSAEPFCLRPRNPRLLLDCQYILYACGLLSAVEPEAAFRLAVRHLRPVTAESGNDCSCAA